MKKQFNLSEKIWVNEETFGEVISLKDVKEFIRLLKEEVVEEEDENTKIIEELAGDKLK